MIETNDTYVVQTAVGGWRVAGSRVSLDSIVESYWEGVSPEGIVAEFPSLTSEQVYGSIAFYLGHRGEIDQYMRRQESRWQELKERSEAANAPLLRRLRAAHKSNRTAG